MCILISSAFDKETGHIPKNEIQVATKVGTQQRRAILLNDLVTWRASIAVTIISWAENAALPINNPMTNLTDLSINTPRW
jgi:hypothetical protein